MFVLLGSNGNITSKAAHALLVQGKRVRVIGRNAAGLSSLKSAGADLAVGDAGDRAFLASAFRGAEAVYTMIPPHLAALDVLAHQDRVGAAIAGAVADSGVRRVVNLSSIGAHLASGTGPIAGLYRLERRFAELPNVNVLHLRPGYFYENHFNALGTILGMGVYADMIDSATPIPSVATADIAAVVARELAEFKTTGQRVLHLHAEKKVTQSEAAAILGRAIGKPDLKHVKAPAADVKAGMMQHGLSRDMADKLEEMNQAFSTPEFGAALASSPAEIAPTSLQHFAETGFRAAFEAMKKAA